MASRHATKVASRTEWLEARGMSSTGGDAAGATLDAPAAAGMMKNEDGLDFVRLVSPNGSSAEIYLYGGVVTSYKDAEGTEFIAVRPDAKMDGSKPISGGLSHCWPQVRVWRICRISKLVRREHQSAESYLTSFHQTSVVFYCAAHSLLT
jgi:glucose-6-phosphate 1-epimerase